MTLDQAVKQLARNPRIPLTFDEAVERLAREDGVDSILIIPGVWEVIAEYYNNDAINLVDRSKPEEEDQEDCEDCGGSGLITADNGEVYSCDAAIHPFLEEEDTNETEA